MCDANNILLVFGGCSDSFLEKNTPRAFGIFYIEDEASTTAASNRIGSQHEEPTLVRDFAA